MRDALFILIVIAVLLCLTAIKYRKQIVTMIEFYKQVKSVPTRLRDPSPRQPNIEGSQGIQLIKCSRCAKWIPQHEATGDVSSPLCRNGCEIARQV